MTHVTCPHCSQPSALDDSLLGHAVTCGVCGESFLAQSLHFEVSVAEAQKMTFRETWRAKPLNERIAEVGVYVLLVVVLAVFGWFKYQDHREEIRRETWAEENAIAIKQRDEKRRQEKAKKEAEADLRVAELEKQPIPDALSGRWTWIPATHSRIFLTLGKGDDGFFVEQSFLDGSKTLTGVTPKRSGATIELHPKEESPTGDYWVLEEGKDLLIMDGEGKVGKAAPTSAPLEIKGIRMGMTELEVARAIGPLEDFTIAGVAAELPPILKYGEDGRLDEFWFTFDGNFGSVLEALNAKYPSLDSDDGETYHVSGDEAVIQLTKSIRRSSLAFLSRRAIFKRDLGEAQKASERKKDI